MSKIRVYLAAAMARREQLLGFALQMPEYSELYCTWLMHSQPDDVGLGLLALRSWAIKDSWEVATADAFITWREEGPVRGGHLVEMGIAIGHGIPVLVIGKRGVVFDHLPGVMVVETESEAILWLEELVKARKLLESRLTSVVHTTLGLTLPSKF